MNIIKMKLQKIQTHEGYCQINYTSKNESGQVLKYCLQDNGEKFGGIRLMRCSQDFEPSHEISLNQRVKIEFEKPKDDDKLHEKCRQFIEKYETEILPNLFKK